MSEQFGVWRRKIFIKMSHNSSLIDEQWYLHEETPLQFKLLTRNSATIRLLPHCIVILLKRNNRTQTNVMYTVFPRIVSTETILFWKLECGKYSREETIFFNLEIVANSNSCHNISIFYLKGVNRIWIVLLWENNSFLPWILSSLE